MTVVCKEQERLNAAKARTHNWQRWGTYLPERQWGTVREDYSADGQTWTSFPYEMAQYRAYRWGEDGLLGWTDRQCRLTFSTSLWNGKDDRLKERLFGLTGPQGNHGEDVKELFYYVDATPTGSYARALYKYPQRAFPYQDLIDENARRGYADSEYELLDTGVFDEDRYFDVQVEYAKREVEDMLIRLTVANRGPEAAELTLVPTLTFRNSWSWRDATKDTKPDAEQTTRPSMALAEGHGGRWWRAIRHWGGSTGVSWAEATRVLRCLQRTRPTWSAWAVGPPRKDRRDTARMRSTGTWCTERQGPLTLRTPGRSVRLL